MNIPGIYADFQSLDDCNRVKLTCAGSKADLARQHVELREGMILALYTDDADDQGRPDELRAEGVAHFNEAEDCWVASINWSALRHASDEPSRTTNGTTSPRAAPSRDDART